MRIQESAFPSTSPYRFEAHRPVLIAGAALIVLSAWTASLVLVPQVRFDILSPRSRPPLETVGFVATALVGAFAYFRFTVTGFRGWLFVSIAFLVLATSQLVFGVILPMRRFAESGLSFYQWTSARFLAAGLLVGAAGRSEWTTDHRDRSPLESFVVGSVAALALMAFVALSLAAARNHLPRLTSALPSEPYSLSSLTAVDLVLGGIGAALFFVAAWRFRLVRDYGAMIPWLIAAMILAAFAHIHYMLYPTVFSNRLSTGDLLRLGRSLVLLVGFVWEMRRGQLAELQQSRELSAAYAAERARVSEMDSLDRSKAELFGLLTHELMHPVAAIRGFAVTLQRRWDQLDEEQRIAIVDRIEHQTTQLRDMAEEAITVTQLETQSFEVAQRIESAVELVREAADIVDELDGRLKVSVDDDAEHVLVWCDRTRILQVLRNLLSNADKYSEPETPIELRLGESDGLAVFSVSDEGPGISQEDLARLFRRFSRIRPAGKERIPGSGLGLYICKRIVEAHAGQIWVESRPGEGTTFLFSIPKADQS